MYSPNLLFNNWLFTATLSLFRFCCLDNKPQDKLLWVTEQKNKTRVYIWRESEFLLIPVLYTVTMQALNLLSGNSQRDVSPGS